MLDYQSIDIPFNFRHLCWFCGEPCHRTFKFPSDPQDISRCEHAPLLIPCCQECLSLAQKVQGTHTQISEFRTQYKQVFTRKYQSHLAIGKNWTKQELEESELSGKAFAGFKKSAWMMFEIAQQRLLFQGWPIQIDGQAMVCQQVTSFTFDGEEFASIDDAIMTYSARFQIHPDYLSQVVNKLGGARFSVAVRHCRINPLIDESDMTSLVKMID